MPETRLHAKLLATTAVTDLVGARIYPDQRYQGTVLPAITYLRASTSIPGCSTGTVNVGWARIQVNCIASTYSRGTYSAKALADAVRTALRGWSDTDNSPNVDQCNHMSEFDAPEEEYAGQDVRDHVIIQEYMLQYGV